MNIVIAQLNPIIGAVSQNLEAMLSAIEQAKRQGAQVIIFPELSVPGYPPKDLLYYPDFIEQCFKANETLTKAADESLLVIWGNIARNMSGIGKPLHNAGYCAFAGNLLSTAHKAHLPTYDVFDEARYFEPAQETLAVPVFECFGSRLALTICEDLWSHDSFTPQEKAEITPVRYHTKPLEKLKTQPVDFLLNISASPYVLGKPDRRNALLKRIAAAQQSVIIYANQVGANDDIIFDGHSSITDPGGKQWVASGFNISREMIDTQALPDTGTPVFPSPEAELIDALVLGIRDYAVKTGFGKVFIGLSGGIDSALTAALAQQALGPQSVIGIAMPGPYSSTHSLEDAQLLARNLGIELRTHPINAPFQAYLDLLSEGRLCQDLAEQNLQSRLRGVLLMTLANRENALVLSTGNKSELATGYSTLYGDSCGALAPLGDIFKTQVYQLCRALNDKAGYPLIPQRVLEKPPSAELAPNQLDTDSLPPYPILDAILKGILEDHMDICGLLGLGYDKSYVYQTLRRLMIYEYKRQQMPPTLKVSRKAFGSGRVFPIVQQVDFPAVREAACT